MPLVRSSSEAIAAIAAAAGRAGAAPGRTILGIAGPPGAGKSSLAERLVQHVPGSVLVPMDGFHLAQHVLDQAGLANRKGAPETFDRAGFAALLRRIRNQQRDQQRDGSERLSATVYAPTFRRDIEEPIAGAIPVPPDAPLVVTEGNYLLYWPEVRDLLDEVWWVEVPDEVRLARLVARHEAYGKPPDRARAWARGSDEANARLVSAGRASADIVVTEQ